LAARNTSHEGVIAVACREGADLKCIHATWVVLESARVEVRLYGQEWKVCCVPDGTLQPASLRRDLVRRLGRRFLLCLEAQPYQYILLENAGLSYTQGLFCEREGSEEDASDEGCHFGS
jgi:hypothetical protein